MALLQHNQLNILKISVTYIDKLNKQSKKVNYAPKSIFGTSFVLNGLRYTHTPKSMETLSALHQFLLIFKNNSKTILLNDYEFITVLRLQFENNPKMTQRGFQDFFEVFFYKRPFILKDSRLAMAFDSKKISVQSFLKEKLPDEIDYSTIFTFLQTHILSTYPVFNSVEFTIYPTPKNFPTDKTLTPAQKLQIETSLSYTGNSCPDVRLYNQEYDFKNGTNYKFLRNQIYYINENTLNSIPGTRFLNNMVQAIECEIYKASKKTSLFDLDSLIKYKDFIDSLLKTKELSPLQRFNYLLEFRIKQLSSGTDIISLPLFIPVSNSYKDDESIESILKGPMPVLDKGPMTCAKVRELATQVGSIFLSPEQQQTAGEATKGAFKFSGVSEMIS